MSPTSYQTAPPRVKLGTNYTTRDQHRSTETLKHKKARTRRACLFGTEEGTRTPTAYGHYHLKVACLPIPPPRQKPLLLLFYLRNLICVTGRGSRLENRYIIYHWLGRWNLQHCRIRQTNLREPSSLLGCEECQAQTGQEKNAGKYSSKPTEKGRGTLATEYGCRSACTKGCSCIGTLALLQQHQHNHTNGNQQMHHNHNSLQHLISSPRRDRSHQIHSLSERHHQSAPHQYPPFRKARRHCPP